jgi:hypothetical protein
MEEDRVPRWLVVVRWDREELYVLLRERLRGIFDVEVILDHRHAERRTATEPGVPERRRGERRQHPPFREREQWGAGFRIVRIEGG